VELLPHGKKNQNYDERGSTCRPDISKNIRAYLVRGGGGLIQGGTILRYSDNKILTKYIEEVLVDKTFS